MAARTILFDLNGTLLDPGVLATPWGDDRAALALHSLDDAVGAGMAATLSGSYRPFSELLAAALERRVRLQGLDVDKVEEALSLTKEMPPYPEVPGALNAMGSAGARLAVLTNSTSEDAEKALATARLEGRFELITGTEQVQAFKPDPRPYHHACELLEAEPGEVTMVAAHWWDVEGAKRAGLRTAWVGRRERILRETVPEPDVRGEDMRDIAAALTT